MCRLASSRLRIPWRLRLLPVYGAVTTIGSMWLFSVDSFAVHAIMTGALAARSRHPVCHLDLDDCFNGNWQCPTHGSSSASAYLARRCALA
jgi:hypothetical protein